MRLNKYLAAASPLSRRSADTAIDTGRVTVDGQTAVKGIEVDMASQVKLDGKLLTLPASQTVLILNKPVGYVCSRKGQGSQTVYDLLPVEYHSLNPVGRLDKDSSGLLLMTDDGKLAQQLTHPRYAKTKVYEITLDKPLAPLHQQMISDHGVILDDGVSKFTITKLETRDKSQETRGKTTPQIGNKKRHASPSLDSCLIPHTSQLYQVQMTEGRNRQIRRTLKALGYTVVSLHRTHFGPYSLSDLAIGCFYPLPTG